MSPPLDHRRQMFMTLATVVAVSGFVLGHWLDARRHTILDGTGKTRWRPGSCTTSWRLRRTATRRGEQKNRR